GAVGDPGRRRVVDAATAFRATLRGAVALLDPGFDPTTPAAVAAQRHAEVQHDTTVGLIRAESTALAASANGGQQLSEVGTWSIVLLGSLLLVMLFWRWQALRRRGA